MQEHKKCTKCGETKLKTCFHVDNSQKDNLTSNCKKCISEHGKKRYKENPERKKENSRKWRKENPEYNKKRYQENPEYFKKYREENSAALKKTRNARDTRRRRTDPFFSCKHNISRSISGALKEIDSVKNETTLEILGCGTYEKFKEHMQSQFSPGMTWDKYGEWHNDHIVPLATAKTNKQIKKLNHYTNLQPLWAKDNMSKGASLSWRK